MKPNFKKLIPALLLPLAVGGLSALISGGMDDYKTVVQPPLSPPGWLFPIVWTILYLLMGYSSYRIWVSDAPTAGKRKALGLYLTQLFVNFIWSPVFFGLNWYLTAFFVLIAMWILVFLTIRSFSEIDETAGDLLLPYLLWISFAGYLNLGVYLLN